MKMKTAKRPVKSGGLTTSETPKNLVRIAGLEPARVAPLPPQSSVSANSTICAQDNHNETARSRLRKGFSRRRTEGAHFVSITVSSTAHRRKDAPHPGPLPIRWGEGEDPLAAGSRYSFIST